MKKTVTLLTVLIVASGFIAAGKSYHSLPGSDTTKNAAKNTMGYKYNKQHHLKANGKPSKLYPAATVKDTLKRKG